MRRGGGLVKAGEPQLNISHIYALALVLHQEQHLQGLHITYQGCKRALHIFTVQVL